MRRIMKSVKRQIIKASLKSLPLSLSLDFVGHLPHVPHTGNGKSEPHPALSTVCSSLSKTGLKFGLPFEFGKGNRCTAAPSMIGHCISLIAGLGLYKSERRRQIAKFSAVSSVIFIWPGESCPGTESLINP